jgi:hypothetical protein
MISAAEPYDPPFGGSAGAMMPQARGKPQPQPQPVELPAPPWAGKESELLGQLPGRPAGAMDGLEALKLKDAEPYDPPAPRIDGPMIGRPLWMDRFVPEPPNWRQEERELAERRARAEKEKP